MLVVVVVVVVVVVAAAAMMKYCREKKKRKIFYEYDGSDNAPDGLQHERIFFVNSQVTVFRSVVKMAIIYHSSRHSSSTKVSVTEFCTTQHRLMNTTK